MADIIQIRRDTAANWTSANPILADGEYGFEKDTKKGKIGDGVTAWTALTYAFLTATGNIVQGSNVTLTGTLTGRLVGTGDVTIEATASGVSIVSETNASAVRIDNLSIGATTGMILLTGTLRDITGIIAGGVNRKIVLVNNSGDFFNVTAEGTASDAANRFAQSVSFNTGAAVEYLYNTTVQRWMRI